MIYWLLFCVVTVVCGVFAYCTARETREHHRRLTEELAERHAMERDEFKKWAAAGVRGRARE